MAPSQTPCSMILAMTPSYSNTRARRASSPADVRLADDPVVRRVGVRVLLRPGRPGVRGTSAASDDEERSVATSPACCIRPKDSETFIGRPRPDAGSVVHDAAGFPVRGAEHKSGVLKPDRSSSSNREEIRGLGRAPALSMGATAPDRLLTGSSQTIGKLLVAVPSAPASYPRSWQSTTPRWSDNGWTVERRAASRDWL